MCNMTIRHNQAIITNFGFPPVFGAPVNGNKFADGGVVSNLNRGIFTFKFKILRNCCNYCTRKNAAVFTNPCTFHNGYIAANPGAFTNFYILVNNT